MQIHGFQKTTLLDYPGHIAATVFTGSCNFRCPFCHNSDLVLFPQDVPIVSEEEIFTHLKKRQGILDGVCITGGEPTLQTDLPDFILKVRSLGYAVKLDTNGYRPDVLAKLCDDGLIDYVAMDIKHAPVKYNDICQVTDFDFKRIQSSVDYLIHSSIPYEFRTTIVKELHTAEDISAIGSLVAGARSYYLQSYKDSEQVMKPGFHAHSKETLLSFQTILNKTISHVEIRGVD